MQLHTATRRKTKLRIGLAGPSGSGKTYSALLLARGIATSWDKIALIDTENGSGELYSHLGEYKALTLQAPFTPERYIEAIKTCENAGIEVVVIDSITHEWDGTGGCLELVEKLGGRYQDWAKVTPRHNAFIQGILQSTCHVITTVRKKQDYDMVKDDRGKLSVQKVGLKEVTRDGFEYELTLSFSVDMSHFAKASKDRTGLFMDKPEEVITEKTGEKLLEWAESGKEPKKYLTNEEIKLILDTGDDWVLTADDEDTYLNGKPVQKVAATRLVELQLQQQAEKKQIEQVQDTFGQV